MPSMCGECSVDGGRRDHHRRVHRLVGKMLHTRTRAKTTGLEHESERRNDHDYGNEQNGTLEGRVTS